MTLTSNAYLDTLAACEDLMRDIAAEIERRTDDVAAGDAMPRDALAVANATRDALAVARSAIGYVDVHLHITA